MQTRTQLYNQARDILDEVVHHYVRRSLPLQAATVQGLAIRWNTRLTSTAGKAVYSTKTVELSWPVFSLEENQDGLRNTVLHEIAHHLVPGGHSHMWRSLFMSIGGDGKRCHKFKITRKRGTVETVCVGCRGPIRLGPVRMRRLRQGTEYRCKCGTPVSKSLRLQVAAERPRDIIQR